MCTFRTAVVRSRLVHIGSLIAIYPTLGAEHLSQIVLFPCILCFQASTRLKRGDCPLHHNDALASAPLLSSGVVRIREASRTPQFGASTTVTSDLDHLLSVNTGAEGKESTRHSTLLGKDLLLLSLNKL